MTTDVARTSSALAEPEMQMLAQLEAKASIIGRVPGLKKGIKVEGDAAATRANVLAICLTSLSYGIEPNLANVNSWDVIEGVAVPSTQLMQGMVGALTGHRLQVTGDETSATATLRRTDGDVHTETYTVEQARKSGALDCAYERWDSTNGGKRFLAERVVIAYDLDEARAAAPPEWARKGPNSRLKYNPAWHLYRADMLKRRATRRAIRFGAPEVAAGIVAPRQMPEPEWQTKPTIATAFDYDDEGVASPELSAGAEQAKSGCIRCANDGLDVDGLVTERLATLTDVQRDSLRPAWKAAGLPALAAADAWEWVDVVAALALMLDVVQDSDGSPSEPSGAGTDEDGPRHPSSSARESSGSVAPEPAAGGVATPPTPPARPLAQQVAMQARSAGIDHHHVVAAITAGRTSSAKDLTTHEGVSVLAAIEDVRIGRRDLVETDGNWDVVEVQYGPDEEPFE